MSCSGDYCPISRCPKSSNSTRALIGGGVAALAYAAYCYFKRPSARPAPARFTIFVGCLAHSLSLQQPLQLLERAALVVDRQSGLIVRMVPEVTDPQIQTLLTEFKSQGPVELRRLPQHQFLVPGFIDTHTHAPQSAFAGTGRIPLLEWLLKYTFPTECKFQSLSFAQHIYSRCVRRVLWSGTTTCCYYGTIHTEATVLLAKLAAQAGQRAFVGKVCMDRNAPDYYCEESAAASAQATRDFVQQVQALDTKLVVPIITPRFAPTCSSELMIELGNIAREHSLPIQVLLYLSISLNLSKSQLLLFFCRRTCLKTNQRSIGFVRCIRTVPHIPMYTIVTAY
jgi:guanine deaminase